MEHILERIGEVDEVEQVTLVTNNKFYQHFQDWRQSYSYPKPIHILNDMTTSNEDRLGAIGDLHLVVKQQGITDDVLLIAGDNLFNFSLQEMREFQKLKGTTAIALYDVGSPDKVANRLGVAIMNEQQRIIDFEEKPAEPKSTHAATCCYLITSQNVAAIENYLSESGKFDNAGDLIAWLSKQEPGVHGFTFSGYWFDVGSHESLQEARDRLGGS